MHIRLLMFACAALSLIGCTQQSKPVAGAPSVPPKPGPAPAAHAAAPPAPAAPSPPPGKMPQVPSSTELKAMMDDDPTKGFKLTAAKLDAYIALRRTLEELGRAGSGAPAASPDELERRAKAAAEQSGLSSADFRAIEYIVDDTIHKRLMVLSEDNQKWLESFERMVKKATGAKKEGIQELVANMKAQRKDATTLAEARKKYGEATVKLVLSREEPLTALAQPKLAALKAARQPAAGPGASAPSTVASAPAQSPRPLAPPANGAASPGATPPGGAAPPK